uniref:Dynein attachment factor N-terminal domain-containing protein n=1 Tax=Oryzias melastigma TaxID=30732 RepID=A0A3B3CNT4_ORYME
MSQRDVIDFLALERELKAAVESEHRYDRENEAKLRAVNQGVSYQQFRNLVLSSHLKPLEKKDTDGAPRKQPWNPCLCSLIYCNFSTVNTIIPVDSKGQKRLNPILKILCLSVTGDASGVKGLSVKKDDFSF